ncbi:MAG: alpha-ketoglutarate-dependent dioxygenase AlkB [Pseudomonadota bacterium]
MSQKLVVRGFEIYRGLLDGPAQVSLLDDVRAIVRAAPFVQPDVPRGGKMSVRMTSAGDVGWTADRSGYRYADTHPSGVAWPPIPPRVLAIWATATGLKRSPDSCLVNYYGADARMGMHQDKDEASYQWPVLSISLGDDALFRIGSPTRGGKTESLWLASGDVVVMGGEARLTYHGVDRLRFGSSRLLPKGGRINLTCRVAT